MEASGRHHNCFGRLSSYGLDENDAQAGLEAFAEASALADTDAIRSRVQRASVCAYKAALEPVWHAGNSALDPEVAKKMRPLAKRFFELCEKHAIDRPRESGEDVAGAKRRLEKALGLAEGNQR